MDEDAIDWQGLVDKALGDADTPPNPGELLHTLCDWEAWFCARYNGNAIFPADYPEAFVNFISELKKAPTGRGRPRCDQAQVKAAAVAWTACVLRGEYQYKRRMFKALAKSGRITGPSGDSEAGRKVDALSYQQEKPCELALAEMAEQYDVPVEAMRNRIFPNRKKRK